MQAEDRAWLDYRRKFHEVYDDANYASPLQAWVMRASHRLIERKFGPRDHFGSVLEIGAGTGEHIRFVRHGFDEYILSDINAKALEVAQAKLAGMDRGKVRFETQDESGLKYDDNRFDRVVAVHVLEHIYKPHLALKEWCRVLKTGGVLSVLIPTDPGLAWRLGRRLGPRRNALAAGIAYDYVMAREHVNSCSNLVAILRHYFSNRQEVWWPLAFPSVDLNLFLAFHATIGSQEH